MRLDLKIGRVYGLEVVVEIGALSMTQRYCEQIDSVVYQLVFFELFKLIAVQTDRFG
jgi:hypothetical protein